MYTLDEKSRAGLICTEVWATRPDQITWKFNDGSEVVTNHDLSELRGQLLFAQDAEKLGFGDRRDIARLAAIADHVPGPGAILQRLPV